jgi:hypothetical protein
LSIIDVEVIGFYGGKWITRILNYITIYVSDILAVISKEWKDKVLALFTLICNPNPKLVMKQTKHDI